MQVNPDGTLSGVKVKTEPEDRDSVHDRDRDRERDKSRDYDRDRDRESRHRDRWVFKKGIIFLPKYHLQRRRYYGRYDALLNQRVY